MEYGFSILMFCFSGAILFYSGLLVLEKKRPDLLIPRRYCTAKMGNPVKYARRLAKILALTALAPFLAGIAGLFGQPLVAGIVFVVALVFFLWFGVRLTTEKDGENQE